MKDPYEVLGLKPTATDEEIKAAYHELVKKYHPDKYQDNPLAELAGEKLREVNEAYDALMKQGHTSGGGFSQTGYGQSSYTGNPYAGGSYGQSSYGQSSYSGSHSGNSYGGSYGSASYGPFSSDGAQYNQAYAQIRAALNRGELNKANEMLINSGTRDAEWYYLSGILSYRRGYVDDALINIRKAMDMAPSNLEYRQMYQRLTGSGTLYQATSNNRGYSGSDMCTQCITCYCCSSLISPCW